MTLRQAQDERDGPGAAEDRKRAEAVEHFGRTALPAETMVYFSGQWLVQSDPAVRAARRLIDLGLAIPTQKRLGPGLYDYYLTKRRNAEATPISRGQIEPTRRGDAAALRHAQGDRNDIAEDCAKLMAVLRGLVARGAVCPPDAELAARAFIGSKDAVRYRLNLLQANGRINLATTADGSRVVTIVASGRSTARVAGCPGDSRGRRS